MSQFPRSFVHAFSGLGTVFRTQPNMRVHLVAAAAVVVAGFALRINPIEWGLILICIGMVIGLECANTAIEQLADRVTTEQDPLIRCAKDCAAAAVLAASVAAALVGGIVFIPKLFMFFR